MLWVTNITVAPVLLPDVEQQVLHFHAGEFVERAERLVHQQKLRLVDERTAQRDALLHAAGQLRRIGLLETFKADQRQQILGGARRRGIGSPEDFHRKQNIGEDCAPRHQIRLLEHDAEIGLRLVHVAAVDLNRAARCRHQPADDLQERRLAAAARPEQGHQRAGFQIELIFSMATSGACPGRVNDWWTSLKRPNGTGPDCAAALAIVERRHCPSRHHGRRRQESGGVDVAPARAACR